MNPTMTWPVIPTHFERIHRLGLETRGGLLVQILEVEEITHASADSARCAGLGDGEDSGRALKAGRGRRLKFLDESGVNHDGRHVGLHRRGELDFFGGASSVASIMSSGSGSRGGISINATVNSSSTTVATTSACLGKIFS